jgi:hypothetical protein
MAIEFTEQEAWARLRFFESDVLPAAHGYSREDIAFVRKIHAMLREANAKECARCRPAARHEEVS